LEAARLEHRSYSVSFRWRDTQGQWRFIREEGRPGYDDQGRLSHFDGLWIDVSREWQAQQDLRQQLDAAQQASRTNAEALAIHEQRLALFQARAAALQLGGVVIETDAQGLVQHLNDEAQVRLGRSRNEVMGQPISNWLSAEHSATFLSGLLRTVGSGQTWRGLIKLQPRNADEFWCRSVITSFTDPSTAEVRLLWMLQDAQRELEQEQALRQLYSMSQERERERDSAVLEMEKIQELILENQLLLSSRVEALNQSAMVSETDGQGRITHVNDQALQVWGFSREEAVGRRHNLIASDHHSRSFFALMWSTLTAGQVWRGQLLNRSKRGDYFWIQLTITPMLDGMETPSRYIGIAFDVTERVRQSTKAGRLPETSRVGALEARMQQVLRHIGGIDREALRPTFDQLPFPAAELDERWRFRRANAAFQERTGWQLSELAGESIALVLQAEQSSGASLDQLAQVLSEHQFAYAELQYIDRQRTGKRFATAFALQQQPDGPAIWMLLFDLEKQLQVGSRSDSGPSISERMIERLTAHTLYFEMDLDGSFSFVHDRLLALLGRSSEELLGKPFPVISSRRTPVALFEGMIYSLNKGKTWYGSLEWVDVQGTYIRVIGAVAPILGAGRVVERIVGLFVEYDRFDVQALDLHAAQEPADALTESERRPTKQHDQA
jgi:PAS domain S-box-containing protein